MKESTISVPENWRFGQFVFNFLWWLNTQKRYGPEYGSTGARMGDPFHVSDEKFVALLDEYLSSLKKKKI